MRLNIDPKTQREEWLEGRRTGLGASDVPAILLPTDRRPKYMSPWKVWRSKVHGVEEDLSGSLFVEFGNKFERAVGEHIAGETGMHLTDGGVYQHDDHAWMRATPDFWLEPIPRLEQVGELDVSVYSHGLEREGVECKVIQNNVNASDWLVNSAPPHVTIQAAWCMAVTGAKRWHIGALLWFTQDFRHYVVDHDPELEAILIERAGAWWQRHVVEGNQPAVDDTDACSDAMADRHNPYKMTAKTRVANDVEGDLIAEWRQWHAAAKLAETEKKRCQNMLKDLISGDRAIESAVHGKVTWGKCAGKSSLNQKALKEAHPDIFALFTKQGDPYRRMTFAKPKNK